MKIHCAKCGIDEELKQEEVKEASNFILNNNLEAIDYLSYFSLKRGKKCDNKKSHIFLFDSKWQEDIIKLTRDIKDNEQKYTLNEKLIEEMQGKVKQLEHQIETKVTENSDINLKKNNIINQILETTGNDRLELWK